MSENPSVTKLNCHAKERPAAQECNPTLFNFALSEAWRGVEAFDGGRITSDAGALLLVATDRVLGLTCGHRLAPSP